MRLHEPADVRSMASSATIIARAATCRILQHLERAMEEALGASLATGPYRGLLFDIYLAEIDGKAIYQSSLSTDEVASKPHRRSIKLAQLGALIRQPNAQDRRRTDLRLTAITKQALDQSMDTVRALLRSPFNESAELKNKPLDMEFDEEYQHNLNVLSDHERHCMIAARGKLLAGGRLALPANIRRLLGLQIGDPILFEFVENQVRIRSIFPKPQPV
jgi:DNA-binding MarR family transcriptional regulator